MVRQAGGGGREVPEGGDIGIIELIHAVQEKPAQHWKARILQVKNVLKSAKKKIQCKNLFTS